MKVGGNDALDFIFNSVLKLCAFYLQACFCECKIELCLPYEVLMHFSCMCTLCVGCFALILLFSQAVCTAGTSSLQKY